MRPDKPLAIKLRLQGNSYTQIQRQLSGISKSTLSAWLGKVVLPDTARQKIAARVREKSLLGLLKRNRNQTFLAEKRKKEIQEVARREIKLVSRQNLFFIGISLYWAEGYKLPIVRNGREVTYHAVSLTNSDPKLLQMFLRFLREICGVPIHKIKINLRIFPHHDENQILNYWSDVLKLPKETNFSKTCVVVSRSSLGKRPFNRLPFGVVQIRISDTNLYHRIMGWIAGLKNFSNL